MQKPDTLPCLGTIDVAVIGGGPAGAACALTLRTYTSHSVVLLEATTYEAVRVGENVSSALLPLLEYLGIQERFLAAGAHIESVAVQACWGHATPVQQHALRHWAGEGFLLNRGIFDTLLTETVHARGGKVYLSCRLEKISLRGAEGGWLLQVRHTSGKRFTLQARFLVDASGRKASIAKRLGAHSTCHDSLIGVSRFFEQDSTQPCAQEILIESTQDGWWYSAPVPEKRLVLTFMTDAAVWRAGNGRNPEKWHAFLCHAPHTLARIQNSAHAVGTAVTIRPAHSHLLDEATGKDWLAVGDASASFDPLSSLGIGFALHSACHAAHAIADYLAAGNTTGLRAYNAGVQQQFRQYFPTWRAYYAYEKRWQSAPFWQTRQS
jgi:flavin-dependent dehydrogenase